LTRTTAASVAALLTLTCALPALAQQPAAPAAPRPAAPAGPAVSHGAAVPGVCVLSVDGAIARSTVGGAVDTRMKQIISQVNAELNAEKTAIDNEAKTLEGQRATLQASQFETRAANLQVRSNELQRKAQLRENEIRATQQKALSRIGTELNPVIQQVYQQRQCSLLINAEALVVANPTMDITQPVTTALNAKITTFAFDRERLDQQAQAQAPAAAATTRR
jgi:Skp family chaperone for outer membrane proteins